MTDFLKTMFLVNGTLAVGFAAFYELVMFCNDTGISPWWSAVPYLIGYVLFLRSQCREAVNG